ncbi:dUTP diphosphatase [Bacteroidota bacterium]
MKVNIKQKEGFEDLGFPKYGTEGSAACDLMAAIDEPVTIKPGETAFIPNGIFVEVPEGYLMHVTPRSGLAVKHGISIVNSPGIVDSDYRGELKTILVNLGKEDFVIERGDRIAQGSFVKVEQADWNKVEELSDTSRGEGGFGHTGHK